MQQRDFRHTVLCNVFVTILLCLFAYQVINNALFVHSHRLSDGTVTIHAHPYQKHTAHNGSKDAGHTHTTQELWLLHMSYHMLFVFFAIGIFIFAVAQKTFIKEDTRLLYTLLYIPFSQNKSPPFL